jgi:hypothetical protein
MADDRVTATLEEIRERTERPVASVTSLPITHPGVRGLMESAADVPSLLAAIDGVLAGHTDCPVFIGADECDHPEPDVPLPGCAGQSAWDTWDGDHPLGAGDVGRICLLTEIGRYCPACTQIVYEDDPIGDSYVDASNCIVRPAISSALLGEQAAPGETP